MPGSFTVHYCERTAKSITQKTYDIERDLSASDVDLDEVLEQLRWIRSASVAIATHAEAVEDQLRRLCS